MNNTIYNRKVAVIGCGFVGSTCAFSLMQSSLFSEMVLIDVNTERAEGEALDIAHGVPYYSPMNIYAGTYEDLADASIVVIAAGANQKPGENSPSTYFKTNVTILKEVVSSIMEQNFNGIIVVVSNPVDILTQVVMKLSGLPKERVMGSGTVLDSARLKYILGHILDVDPRHVHARIIGEHGDSELAVWSLANISGIHIDDFFRLRGFDNPQAMRKEIENEVRNSAYESSKKRATYFGIAPSVTRICEAIIRDEKSIMTVSNFWTELQGVHDVVMSMPAIIGSSGVEYQIPLNLNDEEALHLRESAQTLRNMMNQISFE